MAHQSRCRLSTALLVLSFVGGLISLPREAFGQTGGSQSDWARVERLRPGTQIAVVVDAKSDVRGELLSSDGTGLTVRTTGGSTDRIARSDVGEVRDLTKRGSKRNAIIGAGAGAFVGYVMAVNFALRDCGGSCDDERVLVGVSLVGVPTAGGLLGYHLFKTGNRVVYRRGSP